MSTYNTCLNVSYCVTRVIESKIWNSTLTLALLLIHNDLVDKHQWYTNA